MKLNFWTKFPERCYDPDAVTGIMIDNGADPLDSGTLKIGMFLWFIDGIVFKKRAKLTRLYLWRWKMFNAALVEGTGMLVYLLMVPFFLRMLLPMGVTIAWWITTIFVAPCSFLSKYILYDRWLFKKPRSKTLGVLASPDLSYLDESEPEEE